MIDIKYIYAEGIKERSERKELSSRYRELSSFMLKMFYMKNLLDYKNPHKFKRVFICNLFPFRLNLSSSVLFLIVEGKEKRAKVPISC